METWKEDLLNLSGRQDEIDWLRDRLETMSVREEIILAAALRRQPPETSANVISRILSIPSYGVYTGAGSYAGLAEFFLEYRNDVEIPPDALAFIDKAALGRRYGSLHPGMFIRNSYVECPTIGESRLYDGIHLPTEKYDWSLRLRLASAARPEGVWVCLPDHDDFNNEGLGEIRLAFEELNVEHISQCTLLDARCVLPEINDLMAYTDLDSLIRDGQYLGIRLDARGEGRRHYMEYLRAALELEGCASLAGTLDIEENLDCYDLVLVSELEDYGREMLRQTTGTIFDGCIDYEGYARQVLEQKGFQGVLNGEAYIARNGQTFVSDYEQPPPEISM